jgi:hypothetical protein
VGRQIHYHAGRCHAVSEYQDSLNVPKPKAPEKTETYGKELCIRCSHSAGRVFDPNQVQTMMLNKGCGSSLKAVLFGRRSIRENRHMVCELTSPVHHLVKGIHPVLRFHPPRLFEEGDMF